MLGCLVPMLQRGNPYGMYAIPTPEHGNEKREYSTAE